MSATVIIIIMSFVTSFMVTLVASLVMEAIKKSKNYTIPCQVNIPTNHI